MQGFSSKFQTVSVDVIFGGPIYILFLLSFPARWDPQVSLLLSSLSYHSVDNFSATLLQHKMRLL